MLGDLHRTEVDDREGRMRAAELRSGGSGAAEMPRGEISARQERLRQAIRVRIVAVASRAPMKVDISSDDRGARAAFEEMSLAEFAALNPARLAGLADELQSIIDAGGRP